MGLLDHITPNLRNADKVYIHPNIPQDKLNNAIKAFGEGISAKDVVVLIDDTVMGSAKCGILITDKEIQAKEAFEKVKFFDFEDINNVEVKSSFLASALLINGEKFIGLTQPKGKELQALFNCVSVYINSYDEQDEESISIVQEENDENDENQLPSEMTAFAKAEDFNEDSFWDKAKTVAKKAGEKVIIQALELYYVATDKNTAVWAKTTIYGALAYFVLPIDLTPDAIPMVGFADDAIALGAAYKAVTAFISDNHLTQAKNKWNSWFKK